MLLIFALQFHVSSQDVVSEGEWIESQISTMTMEEKLGQLFMVRAFSKSDDADVPKILDQIKKYHIGGICFFQGSPVRQVELINQYNEASKVPLLIGVDAEWGLGMRFPESTISFPKQIMLGAIQDNNLIYKMGKEIADHCKRVGIHVNFAPVVDINNNPLNPVINDRAFGEDKFNVSAKAYAYMLGMQENGILACAKHFPGHGDTEVDSHVGLPVIRHDMERLRDIELFPFKSLADQGIASVMIAHLHIPAIDDRPMRPTTLSKPAVTDLLRKEIGFDGLVFTDAMEMKGVTENFKDGTAEAEALKAGVDIILLPEDIAKSMDKIKEYIVSGEIKMEDIDKSVRRMLKAKYKCGLTTPPALDHLGVIEYLNSKKSQALKSELIENAITLAIDDQGLVPIKNANKKKILCVSIGSPAKNMFQKRLDSYAKVDHLNTTKEVTIEKKKLILKDAGKYDIVIVSIHDMSRNASKDFGITLSARDLITSLNAKSKVILCVFGNPYSLKYFDDLKTVVMAYEDDDMVRDVTAQSLFGVNAITGKLPVTASAKFSFSAGVLRAGLGKLGFSLPERTGMNSERLDRIDQIVEEIIQTKAAPGCQVLVAKDGKIIFRKSYGKFTYEKQSKKVENKDIYDVASLTKILATTISVMKLYDENKLDIHAPVSRYIPELLATNKSNFTLSDMMAHHAGLRPWIPFYECTVIKEDKKVYACPQYYSPRLTPEFSIPVAQKLFLRTDYRDSIWNQIYNSELRSDTNYKYSDLGFYLAMKTVENVSRRKFDEFTNDEIFTPLGLNRTTFNPLRKFSATEIVPTEKDEYWRNQVVDGTVHDMGAAMLGGVGGHAGLFSNSMDVAVIMQMLLNGGSYGGHQFFSPQTVKYFTTRYSRSTRRGIGFDMKELDRGKSQPTCEAASSETFGHTGFTGTCTFVDPKYNIVYVFLSNRTYPDMNNNALNKKDFRERIQACIYQAMEGELLNQ